HCCNFPDQKFFRAEDVAFDLQRKYFEYSRKKFKPFVLLVREGLSRLNIKDRPDPKAEKANVEGVEVEPEISVVRELISPGSKVKNERKRRAQGYVSSAPKVEDVYVSSDEENDKQFEEVKEVCRLAMHMKRPHTYGVLGVEPPKGFLVHGPPGCGKTLFAQAVAGQFNLPMIQLAATELVSGVSGETEDKIRQLFIIAKQNAPCVLVS
ncbi:unnamed protein product, partial [Strongylus vulgaris]